MIEQRPSFGMIGAYRTTSEPGAALFDSDILHSHYVVLKISHAERDRHLHRDWIFGRKEIIEVAMSEAQWASFVSSMNTSGVPCTLQRLQGEVIEPEPFSPRLEQSMADTRNAAHEAFDDIKAALVDYEAAVGAAAKREALATLRARINNAVPNVDFAGKSLSEHAENVVQRARADIEAIISRKATQMGIEAPERLELLGGGQEDLEETP